MPSQPPFGGGTRIERGPNAEGARNELGGSLRRAPAAAPPAMKPALLVTLALAGAAPMARASEVLDVSPITDRIVLLRFQDGAVIHHKRGQKRSEESVVGTPLDTGAAAKPAAYKLQSGDDPIYRAGLAPTAVGRKSKGTDFAWITDRWTDGRVENDRPDHVDEHWVYLFLPKPMKPGAAYSVSTGDLATNGRVFRFVFDPRKTRSEAVHANTIGYVPTAPAKFAYLYQWAGDKGGLDLSALSGARFWLVDRATGRDVFAGKVAFRAKRDNPETGQTGDTPSANFLGADVYECDFSAFTTPGRYVVAVEGVGCSWPFEIGADVYRLPFVTMARGLYHNRSGIALTRPYTEFVRPAPHNPRLTPGFAGELVYSSLRYLDYGPKNPESGTREEIEPTIKGPIDTCGWYQDAGDWDSYETHLRVAQELLLAYELNPRAFTDGELNLPENGPDGRGNGVPDILDEAAWLPRFCAALRAELKAKGYGTGGIGLRVSGDAFGEDVRKDGTTKASWEDTDRLWVASGEDPVSTYRYAGAAAQLAHCLKIAGVRDPKGVDWEREAKESYAWAAAHTLPKDEEAVKQSRIYAAASLFRMTGDRAYESRLKTDTADLGPNTPLWFEPLYGPAVYALGGEPSDANRDPELLARLRGAVLRTADASHESAERRGLRWGGDFGMPMLIGQQTTPWVLPIAIGRRLLGSSDPAKVRAYTADLYTTCDYFLGTNPTNGTWITGLGPRHPNFPFHMDAWYNGKTDAQGRWIPHPGIIPYSPWRKERDQGVGPWDHDWGNKTMYPAVDAWPGAERYFDNRCSPMGGEFTIHQNTAPAAAIFGVLCAPKG